jgi:hypothetical protein
LNPRPLRHEPAHTNKMVHTCWPKIKWLIHATGTMPRDSRALWCDGTCEVLDVNTRVPVSFTLTPQQKCILCRFLLTALVLLILPTGQHTIHVAHTFILLLSRHSLLLTFAHRYNVTAVASRVQETNLT